MPEIERGRTVWSENTRARTLKRGDGRRVPLTYDGHVSAACTSPSAWKTGSSGIFRRVLGAAIAITLILAIIRGGSAHGHGRGQGTVAPTERQLAVARAMDATVAWAERLDIAALRASIEAATGVRFRIAPRVVVTRLVSQKDDVEAAGELSDRLDLLVERPLRDIEPVLPLSEQALRASQLPGIAAGGRGAPIVIDAFKVASLRLFLDDAVVEDVLTLEIVRKAARQLVDERIGLDRFLDDRRLSDGVRAWRAALLIAWMDLVAARVAKANGLDAALTARNALIDGLIRRAAVVPPSATSSEASRLLAVALRGSVARMTLGTSSVDGIDSAWRVLERPPGAGVPAGGNVESPPLPGAPPELIDLDMAFVEAALARIQPAIAKTFAESMVADLRVVPCERRSLASLAGWRPRAAPSPQHVERGSGLQAASALFPDRLRAVRRAAAASVAIADPRSGRIVVDLGRMSETLAHVDPALRADVVALLLAHAASATGRPHAFSSGTSRISADSESALVVAAIDDAHAIWSMRRIAAAAGLSAALVEAERQTPRERERRALEAAGAGSLALERELDELIRGGLPDAFDRIQSMEGPASLRRLFETPPASIEDLRFWISTDRLADKDPLLAPEESTRRLRRLRDLLAELGNATEFLSTSRVSRELIDQFDLFDGRLVEALDRVTHRVDVLHVPLSTDDPYAEIIAVRLRTHRKSHSEDLALVEATLPELATTLVYRALAAHGPTARPKLAWQEDSHRRIPWMRIAAIHAPTSINVGIGRRSSVFAVVVAVGTIPGKRGIEDYLDAALDRD